MKRALLIVDVQNDYFPGGKMELHNSLAASRNINEVLADCRGNSLPVIHVQHIATRPGATFFLPGTPGAEFHENVMPTADEKIFVKHYPNSFRETGLHEHLAEQQITSLIIVGMMTHMCIDTTVRAAFDLGYECLVVEDCCATKTLKFHDKEISAEDVHVAFLAALNRVFAKVITTQELAAQP
ncbi:isochorismatase hydrolase [Candidatus Moduliflexus flocculans]|uniref:Isochorismatase hydrolase n=1 Tax=Candidatus Moduliflexus flocculans TaxID=1499966 RepID=A0A0S6W0R0_9BACT|nr:isochorismatase hydrolase [Candidatus Moduliflexus flocculans]